MKNKYFITIILMFVVFYSKAQGVVYEPSEAPIAEVKILEPTTVCNPGDCITLTADYFKIKPTNVYTVKPLTYQNLFSYSGGQVIDAVGDDFFSSLFSLPFKFCFYDQAYDKLVVGTNGLISFNAALASQPSGYIFTNTIPSITSPAKFKNAIYGVFQDTNIAFPPVQNTSIQNVNYYTGGTYPNRYFVANFNRLPQYSCGGTLGDLDQNPADTDTGLQTTQIVIYETTNIIDVIVYKRIPCISWENGRGIIGVQNATGSAGLAAPGRNTGNWSVLGTQLSPSEAWRFFPDGADPTPPLVKLEWYDEANNLIGTGDQIVVCPTSNQTYKVKAIYDRCGVTDKVEVEDTISIEIAAPLPVLDPQDIAICTNIFPVEVNVNQDTYLLNGANPSDFEILYFFNLIDAQNQADSQAIPTVNGVTNITLTSSDPVTIYTLIREPFGGICTNIRPFIVQPGVPQGDFSYPDDTVPSTYCFNSNSALAPVADATLGLSSGGTYSVDPPTGLTIDPDTGVLDLTGAIPGTYTINYDIPASPLAGGCPPFNANTVIIIEACIDATVSNSGNVCEGTPAFDLFADYAEVAGATTTYEWTDSNGTIISTVQDPTGVAVPAAPGTYPYSLVITQNGSASNPFVTTLIVHPSSIGNFVSGSTTICTNATIDLQFSGTPGATIDFTDGTNNYAVLLDASGNGTFTTPALGVDTTYTLVQVTGTTVPACTTSLNASITITVGLPTASIDGFTEAVICSGTSSGLEIQGTPGSTVTYTIDGVVQPTATIPASGTLTIDTGVQTVTATTVYTYELTEIVSNSTPLCSDTITGQSASLTVNALPTASFSAAASTVCENTAATLNFVGTPNATVTYNDGTQDLTVLLDGTGNATETTALLSTPTTFTLVSVEVTDTILCSNTISGSVSITIDNNPAITIQPEGSTACINASVTFTVEATGADLTYQWYLNGATNPIAGATSATYTIPSVTLADEGDYRVEVSGSCGTKAVSEIATLIITQPTLITLQPQATTTLCVGQALNLSVTATGTTTEFTYQWFKGTTALAGQTNATLNIASVTTADAGIYTVEITNPCEVVTSDIATVIVNELPVITTQPAGTTVCEGQSITLNVAATGTDLTYQWFLNGIAIPSATGATYTNANVVLTDAGDYTVVVSGACTPAVTSNIATVVINQGAAFTQQPQASTTVCSGESITLTVATTGGTNVSYQWFKGTTAIAGATSTSYTIGSSTVADSGNYTVVVTVASCGTFTSTVAVVVVNQAPVITSQPQAQSICVGQTATFTVVATGTNLTYQWYKGTTAINGAIASTYSISNATVADSGEFYCIITSTSCPNIQSDIVTLEVKPLPTATIAAGTPSAICEGQSTQVLFNGTAGAVVIYTINGGTPETITLNASGTTILPTGTLNETTVYDLVSVTYTGPDACSQTLTGSATITVNPLPEVTLEDGTICLDPVTLATTRTYTLNTGLNEAEFTFEWFDSNGLILLATNSFYEVTTAGQYSVTITDVVTGCQAEAFANVGTSTPPIDFDYTVSGFFAENPTVVITATPIGDYEYQLDYGPFQSSNTFDNISSGTHTITVRDSEGCDVLTKSVLIVDYPRYFTPNGDGINDTWNIPTINGISMTKIYIFDRFGKLIKEISTSGLGWDGTYNGQPLPATDYWFTINYQETGINKEFRAHFSLKR